MQTNAHFIIYQQKLFPLFEHIKSSIVFYSLYTILPLLKKHVLQHKIQFLNLLSCIFQEKVVSLLPF